MFVLPWTFKCSAVLRVAVGGEDTVQEGKGACEALTYCTPGSTVPSTSAMGLGEMSSGRQQAAELDQPPVLQ